MTDAADIYTVLAASLRRPRYTLPLTPERFERAVCDAGEGKALVYHVGHLAHDREHSTDLNVIGMLASGLQMIGVAQLEVNRLNPRASEYIVRKLRPIRRVDFDHGRKTYLDNKE